MKHLFRAKDKHGKLVYGDVVYGSPYNVYGGREEDGYTYLFVTDVHYFERWEVEFNEDGYANDEYYPDWDVDMVEIYWNTLEFNLNGKWIKYEVKHESSND